MLKLRLPRGWSDLNPEPRKKPLTPPNGKPHTVTAAVISPQLYEWVYNYCTREGISVTLLVRYLLVRAMESDTGRKIL